MGSPWKFHIIETIQWECLILAGWDSFSLLNHHMPYYIILIYRVLPCIQLYILVGGLEHFLFSHILGISSSQLTKSIIFQRGRYTTNQYVYIYIYQLTLYPDTCGIWNPHGLVKPETWQNFIGQESLKLSRELPKLDDNVTSGALPGPALPEVEGVMGFDHQHGDIWRTDEWAIQHLRWGFDHH